MTALKKAKQDIVRAIHSVAPDSGIGDGDLVPPPSGVAGDLGLPGFVLARRLRTDPAAAVRDLANRLAGVLPSGISAVAAGPYLNFRFATGWLARMVVREVEKAGACYGTAKEGRDRVVVEYSNANTHKEYHVGHLRNLCFGDSVCRLLGAVGHRVFPVSYINDFGIHTAKTLWALGKFYSDTPVPANRGFFLGKVYARAAAESKDDPAAKEEIALIMKGIESRQGRHYRLWERTRKWSIAGMERIYRELGVRFDHVFYENEYIDEGHRLACKFLREGILKESQGAVIADLEDDGLGVLPIIRSDGTALYPVADLALARAKVAAYRATRSLYVVDIRQSQYFKQLFRLVAKTGVKAELVHLKYDFVKLPSGMMSSRSGNVVTYDELKNELVAQAAAETRKRHPDWPEARVGKGALAMAFATIKFEMLKVGSDQPITFDISEALKFDGYTVAYVLYAGARIESILRKASRKGASSRPDPELLAAPEEHALLMAIAKFPETVSRAADRYDPSEIAKYAFDLSRSFNDYYHQVPVLKAEPAVTAARLTLLRAVRQTLRNALYLLGIEPVKEM